MGAVVGILQIFRAAFKPAERVLRRVLYPAPAREGGARGDEKPVMEMASLRKRLHIRLRGSVASGATAASGSSVLSTAAAEAAAFEVSNPMARGAVGATSGFEKGPASDRVEGTTDTANAAPPWIPL